MKKKDEKRELLKFIRIGIRLKTKPPKQETPKTVYNRKNEKRRSDDDSSFYFEKPSIFNCYLFSLKYNRYKSPK